MAITFEEIHGDEEVSVRCSRSLAVIVWRRTTTARGVSSVTRALEELFRRRPGRVVLCALATARVQVPDDATRRAMQQGIRQIEPHLAGAVNLIPKTGFQAAALRAALTGIALIVRPPYPIAFVGTTREASTFLAAKWPAEDKPAPAPIDLESALIALSTHQAEGD